MDHASADSSHEAIIQQFDAACAVERTVDLSDDGALRLICGRAGDRQSDGALSGRNVAVIAPRDCGELVAGYGLPSGEQFDQDDFAACEAWVGTLERDGRATMIFAPYQAKPHASRALNAIIWKP